MTDTRRTTGSGASTHASTATGSGTDAADRVRMPLIDLIASGALDEEYGEVARRRAPRAPGARRPRPGLLGAVGAVAFAVLVTISFQQTRDNEDVVSASRATLEDRIRSRRESVSKAQDSIVALRDANTAAESQVEILDETQGEVDGSLSRLRSETGYAPVRGEGLRIVVGDSPDGLKRHRVYDEDLALLTNGLWRAGAEAIAVNGQRLTARSGFRFSGSAIRVNFVSLSPPYTVEAIGDKATLAANLLDTTTGLTFQARADEFGFTKTMQNVDRLSLPAAVDRPLVYAHVPEQSDDQVPAGGEEKRP